jgi:hypothetical protein
VEDRWAVIPHTKVRPTQGGGGLHWLLSALLLAVTIAAASAWILLVEVLR